MLKLSGHPTGGISLSWIRRIGCLLGNLVFSVLRVRRRVTLDNIRRSLMLPERQCRRLARKVYQHLCIGALEFLQLGRLTPCRARQILGESGLHRLRQILKGGRGMLVLSAHLGNWDLLACAAALSGFKVNVVTRQIKATWINRYWMAKRRACGVNLLLAHGSARAIVNALRRNEIVAMVLDQHEPGGLPVPFFGRPAATGSALARLARVTGAPVVPAFLLREANGFRLDVQQPLSLARTTSRHSDAFENTRLFSEVLEKSIATCPQQWLWLHRRWKIDSAAP